MVGSHGLCFFRARSTGTTEKAAFLRPKLSLAEPAQSFAAMGLSKESESDDVNGKGSDKEGEETLEDSLKTSSLALLMKCKISSLGGSADTLTVQGASALARVCMGISSDE